MRRAYRQILLPRAIRIGACCALTFGASACEDALSPFVGSNEVGTIVVDFDSRPERWPLDPYRLIDAAVQNDTLTVRIDYGGGCARHDFALVAWNGWLESFPVRVGILLAHDDPGDPCDAVVQSDLRFDLRPLRTAYAAAYGAGPATIILMLTDPSQAGGVLRSVSYAF